MIRFAPALVLLLAACGGGGDEPVAVSSSPPASTPAPAPAPVATPAPTPAPAAAAPVPAPIRPAPVPAPQPAPIAAPSPAPAPDPKAFPASGPAMTLTCRNRTATSTTFSDTTYAATSRIRAGQVEDLNDATGQWVTTYDPVPEGWPGWQPRELALPANPGDRDWWYRYGASPYGPVIRTDATRTGTAPAPSRRARP
jgi:hypothetical protein